jgi:hypothetical protein
MESGRPYLRLLLRLERFDALGTPDRQRIVDLPLKLFNFPPIEKTFPAATRRHDALTEIAAAENYSAACAGTGDAGVP